MRNQNSILRVVLEQNLVERRPLGRSKMRRKDTVKKDGETIGGRPNWKPLTVDRGGCRYFKLLLRILAR